MRLNFLRVKAKNFLSYADLDLQLNNQSYCLIKGENNFEADNAQSNGAGKSTWVNALSWCLTGETVQGIKNNISNIYIKENECWVQVEFTVDNDNYILKRISKPKSYLQIIKNGEDVSGKGIKESEAQLEILLPDLTRELLSSTIILGQGLPHKISSLKASERKELLEKLSKSDFMIEDVKKRLEDRNSELSAKLRNVEDNQLKITAEINFYNNQNSMLNQKIDEMTKINYDDEIYKYSIEVQNNAEELTKSSNLLADHNKNLEEVSGKKMDLLTKQNDAVSKARNLYKDKIEELQNTLADKRAKAWALSSKIKELEAIKDTCPTCGQKLPNAVKPDTTTERANLETLNKEVANLNSELNSLKEKAANEESAVINFYKDSLTDLTSKITLLNASISREKDFYNNLCKLKIKAENDYNKAVLSKQNLESNLKSAREEIAKNENIIAKDISESEVLSKAKDDYTNRLNINKKMITLGKRDYRGYLLINVINVIDRKVKEYCNEVFGHTDIEFKLDGNDIDILFNGKYCESLSGGEQQKVNLIVQFAIRDMLESYADFKSNILVLDEVTDNLDSLGVDKMFNLIENQMSDIDSIFIISHHANELCLSYDKEITVIKDSSGISHIQM